MRELGLGCMGQLHVVGWRGLPWLRPLSVLENAHGPTAALHRCTPQLHSLLLVLTYKKGTIQSVA